MDKYKKCCMNMAKIGVLVALAIAIPGHAQPKERYPVGTYCIYECMPGPPVVRCFPNIDRLW